MLRRKVDSDIETKIIIGMITSDKFLRDLSLILPSNRNNFESSYIDTVAKWCLRYHKKYGKAPMEYIKDIYNTEKERLKDGEATLIAKLLTSASAEFEKETDTLNTDYLLDRATVHIKKKKLLEMGERLQSMAELGDVDAAEKEMQQYKSLAKATSGWTNPFSANEVKNYFIDEQNKSNKLFAFPGQLGKLVGEFERNNLWAILGPAKRGKSFWLQEISIQGVLEGFQVAHISLEMDAHRMKRRMYRRMTAQTDTAGDFIYPCFDCRKNQLGFCTKSFRTNDITLYEEGGEKPQYTASMKYRPCVACRGSRDFVPDTWYELIRRDKFTARKAGKQLIELGKARANGFRFKSYPAFSASVSQIKTDLQYLESLEGFVPDIIVVDYADITAPEDSRTTGRDRIDETWKMLKNMGDEFHGLVVSASQSNRGSFDKKFVGQTDISEDIRKIAHVDGMLSINQTPLEKRQMVTRIAKIAGREEDFDQFETCMVLQNLRLGQVLLDSEIILQQPPKKKGNTRAIDY